MSTTNYTKPIGDYHLVRILGKQAEMLDPETLGKILSILELHEEAEGPAGRPMWDALYRSQPFHSTSVDASGGYWRQGRYFSAFNLPRSFPWAVSQGHIEPAA